MRPIKFKQSNRILTRPSEMLDTECGPLPIFGDGKQCISCWQGNLKERFKYLLTGKMWVWVRSGKTQPPILIDTNDPWRKQ